MIVVDLGLAVVVTAVPVEATGVRLAARGYASTHCQQRRSDTHGLKLFFLWLSLCTSSWPKGRSRQVSARLEGATPIAYAWSNNGAPTRQKTSMNRPSFVCVRATALLGCSLVVRLAFAVLALLSTSAWGEWTYVTGSDEFDAYVDLTTIRKNAGAASVWLLREYGVAHRVEGKAFLSSKLQEEYECEQKQSRLLFISWHTGSTGTGEVVATSSQPTQWRPVVAGSVGQALWKAACGRR